MKLKCKIKDKYLKQILKGEKKIEYRQIESITFIDEQGKEYEFEVKDVTDVFLAVNSLRKKYPDVPWDDNLPTIAIELGRRINLHSGSRVKNPEVKPNPPLNEGEMPPTSEVNNP